MEAGGCWREPVEVEGVALETPSCSRVRVSSPVGYGHWGGAILASTPCPLEQASPPMHGIQWSACRRLTCLPHQLGHPRASLPRPCVPSQNTQLPPAAQGGGREPGTGDCSFPEASCHERHQGSMVGPGGVSGLEASWIPGPKVHPLHRAVALPGSIEGRLDVISPRGDGSRGMPGIRVGQRLWRTPSSIGA